MADGAPTWASTHVGLVRPNNEDRCSTSGLRNEGLDGDWQGTTSRTGGWALVADGMGGHGAGEVASQLAVEAFEEFLPHARSHEAITDAIRQAADRVHEAMFSGSGRPGMGTTVVGVLLDGATCTFFNVGDSRAYILRGGELRRHSRDHTPEADATRPNRSHALTQSLGGTLTRLPLTPHVETVALRPGDLILLCSDGLTDLVSEASITELLAASSGQPAAELVAAALQAGGRDNVTVVVLAP